VDILSFNNRNIVNTKVLEIGCGTGNFAQYFLNRNVDSYVGIDISDGMIKQAEKKIVDKRANFFCSSIEDYLDIKIKNNEKYDMIFSFSVVHHIFNLDLFMQNIKKVLKPNGVYLAIHEPNSHDFGFEKNNVGQNIDEIFSVIRGLDHEQTDFYKRLIQIFSMIYKKLNKSSKKDKNVSEINMVDYQLSSGCNFNATEIIKKCFNSGLDAKLYFYSYYRFGLVKKIFGASNNHFAIIVKNQREF